MNVLVLNSGSASLKFDIVSAAPADASPSLGQKLLSGSIEQIGKQAELTLFEGKTARARWPVEASSYADAARAIVERLSSAELAPGGGSELHAVAYRIVHGGQHFTLPTPITGSLPAFAVFDTAFHHTLPERAYTWRSTCSVIGP